MMNRVKLALVALLPALWLFASLTPLLADCDECGKESIRDSHSQPALEGGEHHHTQHLQNSGGAAQAIHLRGGKSTGKGVSAAWDGLRNWYYLQRPAVAQVAPHSNSADLGMSWQFICRAALDPRAPSFAS